MWEHTSAREVHARAIDYRGCADGNEEDEHEEHSGAKAEFRDHHSQLSVPVDTAITNLVFRSSADQGDSLCQSSTPIIGSLTRFQRLLFVDKTHICLVLHDLSHRVRSVCVAALLLYAGPGYSGATWIRESHR